MEVKEGCVPFLPPEAMKRKSWRSGKCWRAAARERGTLHSQESLYWGREPLGSIRRRLKS